MLLVWLSQVDWKATCVWHFCPHYITMKTSEWPGQLQIIPLFPILINTPLRYNKLPFYCLKCIHPYLPCRGRRQTPKLQEWRQDMNKCNCSGMTQISLVLIEEGDLHSLTCYLETEFEEIFNVSSNKKKKKQFCIHVLNQKVWMPSTQISWSEIRFFTMSQSVHSTLANPSNTALEFALQNFICHKAICFWGSALFFPWDWPQSQSHSEKAKAHLFLLKVTSPDRPPDKA